MGPNVNRVLFNVSKKFTELNLCLIIRMLCCIFVLMYIRTDLLTFSAFRFENYMSNIKKTIRKNEKPRQQLSRRYSELNFNIPIKKTITNNNEVSFEKVHSNGSSINDYNFSSQYKILRTKTYTILSNSSSNSCLKMKL